MKTFKLAKNFSLPESIITETIAVLGIRGSGKTHTAKCIVEEALKNKRQVAIIDPTDAWWGVKSGFPIIVFGGVHGDLPLDEGSGRFIADFLVDRGISCILSLRHLRKAAQKRFTTAFNEQLYFRKGETTKRTPILVVIDECDTFIPQKVMGEDAKSVGAVEDLVRRGRNAGLGVVLISQRAASINKDVLTQLTVLVAHRHTSPQDRKALEAWIQGHDTNDRASVFLGSLASLPVGTAWVWSPYLDLFSKVAIRESETFDSSATPKLGGRLKAPKKLKPVDIEALKEQMKEAIQEQEDNDPRKLKEKIKQLQKNQKVEVTIKEKVVEKPVFSKADIKLLESIAASLTKIDQKFKQINVNHAPYEVKGGYFYNTDTNKLEVYTGNKKWMDVPTMEEVEKRNKRDAQTARINAEINGQQTSGLTSGQRKILTVLAQAGKPLTYACVAIRAGFTQSGTFANYVSGLRVSEYIKGSKDSIEITNIGYNVLGSYESIPVLAHQLIEYWKNRVNKKQAEILEVLHSAGEFSKGDLARAVDLSMSGTYNNYLSQLRTMGLIEGSQTIRLVEDLR